MTPQPIYSLSAPTPLKEDVADIRMVAINDNVGAIKRSKEISFPWENDEGRLEIVRYNLKSAKLDWEKSLITYRMASGSIDIYSSY